MTDAVLAASGVRHPAPQIQPDLRPSADAAALVRDPSPQIPLPMPPGSSQTAVVTETRIATKSAQIDTDRPPERVLKPYGIGMLPESFEKNKVEIEHDEDGETTDATEMAPPVDATDMTEPALGPEQAEAKVEPESDRAPLEG